MHLFTRQNSNTEVYLQNCIVRFGWDVINPLARMRQRVTVLASVCVCVCLSVTTLAAASFISMLEIMYEQLHYGILLILTCGIS